MISQKEYSDYIKKNAQKSNQWRTIGFAFLIGGIICMIGQGFFDLYSYLLPLWEKAHISALVSITMIFLASFLTGIGIYDKIGNVAGAGSIIPITGFANSIVSPAMEFNKEGVIFGTMSKMFIIAGPVVVVGICASIAVGVIYWIIGVV
ncbi:MAG: SpoVA/SpoVAEb family sporulation membrane protein [Clostridia bacterium]